MRGWEPSSRPFFFLTILPPPPPPPSQGVADGDDKPKKPVKAKLGVKNEFYFDEEVREREVEATV